MNFDRSASELIKERFSSRSYLEQPIAPEQRRLLADFLSGLACGPLGTAARFALVAATEQERDALRGQGTYGLIKGATGFLVGVVRKDQKNLEDFGFLMEAAVLRATDLGLGTCWLGGIFSRSSFARQIDRQADEVLPAVTATGYSASRVAFDPVRRLAGSDTRLPWQELFFDSGFDSPLTAEAAGAHAWPLEAVRLGPSASNKQPWRVVRDGKAWHFYLHRTVGYRTGRLVGIADLQRVDLGIAMCHFQLSAAELGLPGHWLVARLGPIDAEPAREYVVSWIGD
jgi:hypothetical protein